MPSVGGDLARPLRRLLNDQGRDNLQNPRAPWTPKQALADLFELKGHDDAADASSSRRAPAPHAAVVPKGLVGGVSAFRSRLAELRGHPVVVNEWASWCLPCRNEFPLFARASIRYGKRVAFLGLNVSDNAGNAATFLRSHPVSYPSYTDVKGAIAASLGSAQALPTTVFFAANGHRVFSHIGYYRAAEALDSDIERYALGQ
jgi:thiol-disulfide isomerase/thioredoxin